MPPLPTQDPEVAAHLKELEAKMNEQTKALDSLLNEKKRLEEELNQAKSASPAPAAQAAGSSDSPQLTERVKTLEAQLAEYAVIEDDLANLKRLQKENKTLRSQLEGLEGHKTEIPPTEAVVDSKPAATPTAAAATPTAAAAAPVLETQAAEPTPPGEQERAQVESRLVDAQNQAVVPTPAIEASTAEKSNTPTAELASQQNAHPNTSAHKDELPSFETLIDDVEKSLAQDKAPGEAATENKTEAQTKSEAELQADFEKMLNS